MIQYEDLGLLLKVEARRVGSNNVFLNIDWKNEELAGSSIDDVPLLLRQELSNSIVLPFHATTLIAGHIEKSSQAQTAGLSSNQSADNEEVQLLITVTPELAGN